MSNVFSRIGGCFSFGIRLLIAGILVTGFQAASFSRTAEAGKLELIPIIGAIVGVPLTVPNLVFCKDSGRRRTLEPISMRSGSAFTMEAAYNDRYWLESGGRVGYWKDHGRNLTIRTFTSSLFCGYKNWEFGAVVSYIDFETDFYNRQTGYEGPEPYVWTPDIENLKRPEGDPSLPTPPPIPRPSGRGIGDIKVSTKRVWKRSEFLTTAAGFRVSVPVAPEEKGVGTGELSFTPFVSGGISLLGLDLRSHTGFEIVNESTNSVPDTFLYGGSIHFRLGKHVAVRTELNGFRFNSRYYLSVEPGLDFRIATQENNIIFRFYSSKGLTDRTLDFSAGGALVFNQR